MFKMLAAVGAYEYDPTPAFCQKNFLRLKVSYLRLFEHPS
jgi:ATP-dependent RNA helicase DHX37/DHR1